jgi:ribosome-associated translation inhibitor RaiA
MSVRISGDFLALDQRVKKLINQHAQAIQDSFPGRRYDIQARIAEEFDQLNGHRVRVELIAISPDRQQIMVREAQKKAEESIKSAFTSLKSKLRRIGLKRSQQQSSATRGTTLPAAST